MSREALIQTLAFKLRHGRAVSRAALCKAYSEEQTRLLAAELVEHMELSGFMVSQKPSALPHSTVHHGTDHRLPE